MINARQQVKNALLTVCDNVKMSRPAGDIDLPLIVYAQTGNTPINMLYDRLKWRVSVYCRNFSDLVDLCDDVDNIMTGLGFTRVGKTGDDTARVETDLYMCKLDYAGLVNKQTLGVIKYST